MGSHDESVTLDAATLRALREYLAFIDARAEALARPDAQPTQRAAHLRAVRSPKHRPEGRQRLLPRGSSPSEPGLWVRQRVRAMVDWWDWAPLARRLHAAGVSRLRTEAHRW